MAARRRIRESFAALLAVFACACVAQAAPNITNSTQKGSLLVFPDILVRGTTNTIVRLSNDGSAAVDVKCTWLDGNKNRTHFVITITKNQSVWFDASAGGGTVIINPFPSAASNGFDNPYLPGVAGPYRAGMLVCFAVNADSSSQVKWNHLYGTATVFDAAGGWAYEYTAHAFFVPTGIDLSPVGTAGTLNLNSGEYDSCPQYLVGSLSPAGTTLSDFQVVGNRLALASCTLDLTDDWRPWYTKLQFDVWNADEVKFTGAYDCANSWHETTLVDLDSAAPNFDAAVLRTDSARFRAQAFKSTQCEGSQTSGLIGVHSSFLGFGRDQLTGMAAAGSTMTAAGKLTGKVTWEPDSPVAEGRIR